MSEKNIEAGERHVPLAEGVMAISPVIVFILSYLVVSIAIGDFYKMPIAVSMLVASVWGVVISSRRGDSLGRRIEIFSQAAGNSNILFMIWIFVLAGAFASLARELGAVEATVNMTLHFFPAEYLAMALFVAACFISLSIGTSVGTVVALVPLAADIAAVGGVSVPFYVAVVLGGAFFGDNLSFISDTTIAATRTQGCDMRDKFRANLLLALPAAVVTLVLYTVLGTDTPQFHDVGDYNPWLVLPYLLIIVMAASGISVTIVLTCGIVASLVLGAIYGHSAIEMAGYMGAGIDSMGNLIIITLMAAGMLGLVKAYGGITWLLQMLTRSVRGTRGAQGVIALLVALVNLCTANNTVAIITVGSISREIAQRFGITPQKAASLLDTGSCIVQCLIPYGAQALLATSLAGISPAAPFPYLYYPWALTAAVIVSILIKRPQSK